MKKILSTLAMTAMVACSSSSDRPPGSGTATGQTGSSAGTDDGPVAIASPADATTLKQHMREHFAAVSDLQRAIARGYFEDAKQDARWIAEHEEAQQLAPWKPFVDEMKVAAREVAGARDLPSAAAVASRLGRACSRCHEAMNAVVTFAWEEAPADAPDLPAQMKRHQWAAARLWDGLVGPSDELWREGALVLATSNLDAIAASGSGAPRGDVPALAKRVRELATTAGQAKEQDARAQIYGELLSTCAGCHLLVRPNSVRP